VTLGLIACGWGILDAGREGLATVLSSYAATMNQLEVADKAVQLSPSNSEAHYIRARLLADTGASAEAIGEYERAVALRPQDYVLWLELGLARDRANDVEGALAAFQESARLAPVYAKPHWQLGNTLFRAGRRDAAFAEIRRAVTSDPRLLPQAMTVVWSALAGDAKALEQALQPQTPSAHLAMASFLARHGNATEAIAQFRAAGVVSSERRQVLLADLLASKSFEAAFEVWSSGREASSKGGSQEIVNGGFEAPIALDDPGFGWQLGSNLQAVRASLDPSEPHEGVYSLRLDWSGDSNPSTAVISQLVLVQPDARYRISFAARSRDMLSIGMPAVTVTDASGDDGRVLQQSKDLPQGTSWWQDFTLEFVAPSTTRAVLIAIRRQSCATTPCAAIGYVWVDDFSMKRL
jgi:Flp pilus assembly protein TadD